MVGTLLLADADVTGVSAEETWVESDTRRRKPDSSIRSSLNKHSDDVNQIVPESADETKVCESREKL